MQFKRSSGILLHPTSIPSLYGIGDFGKSARNIIDFLVHTDQTIWQVLPLCPTGYGNSPYASYSAFAGNYYLIDPDSLVDESLLTFEEVRKHQHSYGTRVDYQKAISIKEELLKKAYSRFDSFASNKLKQEFIDFCVENTSWLDDYSLFVAAFEHHGKQVWTHWDQDLKKRSPKALIAWKKKLSVEIGYHQWLQFEFHRQWSLLKTYANNHQIQIIGDIPIFVDHNSADVWSNPELFEIDVSGERVLVSGVPPDYFSETGQLWGNPLYRWDIMEKQGFQWWIARFKQMLKLFDAIRVDHFRGFDAYWEVKATEKTAINGRWVKGPGKKLFNAIKAALGDLPIIAEDLGVLTQDVIELRDHFDFPGMKILQFAFSDNSANSFLPHNFKHTNCVVYTGTHDNDTTLGWYQHATDHERHLAREYTRSDGHRINWELIRLGMFSVANQCIVPLQDYMNLGSEHRMNFPGYASDMWEWAYTPSMLDAIDKSQIKHLIQLSNRNTRENYSDSNLVHIDTV